MFIAIVKSPKVKSIIGAEINFNTGFMKKLIRPSIKLIEIRVIKVSSKSIKPETI